jgi:hypothetical protein
MGAMCNRTACEKKKDGISKYRSRSAATEAHSRGQYEGLEFGSIPNLNGDLLGSFVCIVTDPPIWLVEIQDINSKDKVYVVKMTTEELSSSKKFRKAVMSHAGGFAYGDVDKNDWEAIIQAKMAGAEYREPPFAMTEAGILLAAIQKFIASVPPSLEMKFLLTRATSYLTKSAEGVIHGYFKLADLQHFLRLEHIRIDMAKLYVYLQKIQDEGYISQSTLEIEGQTLECWRVVTDLRIWTVAEEIEAAKRRASERDIEGDVYNDTQTGINTTYTQEASSYFA